MIGVNHKIKHSKHRKAYPKLVFGHEELVPGEFKISFKFGGRVESVRNPLDHLLYPTELISGLKIVGGCLSKNIHRGIKDPGKSQAPAMIISGVVGGHFGEWPQKKICNRTCKDNGQDYQGSDPRFEQPGW